MPGYAVPEPMFWSSEFGPSRQNVDRTLQPFTCWSLLLFEPELMGDPLSKLFAVNFHNFATFLD
jgi:hypothetical protein